MEDNKLIAEFMQIPTIKIHGGGILYDIERTDLPMTVQIPVGNKEMGVTTRLLKYSVEQLQFNTSWDWLIPVVEKIEGMGNKFQICRRRINIQPDNNNNLTELWLETKEATKIQSVYTAVVQFIKWYNSQKTIV
jgi:hypothetical protein